MAVIPDIDAAAESQLTGLGRMVPDERPQERRFAGAIWSDEPQYLAAPERARECFHQHSPNARPRLRYTDRRTVGNRDAVAAALRNIESKRHRVIVRHGGT